MARGGDRELAATPRAAITAERQAQWLVRDFPLSLLLVAALIGLYDTIGASPTPLHRKDAIALGQKGGNDSRCFA
jgi:hypothetical protein